MQWTKLSVKFAELIFSDASDSVFRTYVRLLLLTSSMEVAPTFDQTCIKLGKRKTESLMKYLESKDIPLDHIIKKVMEDVDSVLSQREGAKKRQQKHRITRDVQPIDKIREDKRREDKKEKEKKAFHSPSVSDIDLYCKERKNGLNAQAIYDHYEANGWMRGKNKIKDWKACVRTWENSRKEEKKVTKNTYRG